MLRIGREKVRIGIDAPPWVPIRLGEERRWPDVAGQPHAEQTAGE